jgi:putative transposase
MRKSTSISVRRACWLVGLSRTVLAYARKPDPAAGRLRDRLSELASTRRRFGYRRLHALLRREGVAVNHKRLYRVYREAGLSVQRRRRRRGVSMPRQPLALPTGPSQVWSMDFVMDALDNGRRLKCLTIVDDFTKESIEIVVDHSIPGLYVTRVLDRAIAFRGCPRTIRTDQGPEFTGRALDQWAYRHGVELTLIAPGKPTQNAFIASFNGRFRDECLNDHWFENLTVARSLIAAWRLDYNECRPHSALQYLTPAEFASEHRQKRKSDNLQPGLC